jgi:outer membrane protein assembly factor BamA
MRFLLLLLFLTGYTHVQIWAQETTPDTLRTVNNITIEGNKRTRDFIVYREIVFKKGELINDQVLAEKMALSRQLLMNTTLFVDVLIAVAKTDSTVDIHVLLKERWYLFPLPYFKLVDRNFNQWFVDQKASLERVNYGLKFIQNNASGRNDNLDIWLITGYTQQITLRYNLPFIDKKLTKGFSIGYLYATQRELNYATLNNKQAFFRGEDIMRKTMRAELAYSWRPDNKQRHYFRVGYNDQEIGDSIIKINPNYYPYGAKQFQYPDFSYQFKYYNTDYIYYPLKGWMLDVGLTKRGINRETHLWQANIRAVYVKPIAGKTFLHLEGFAAARTPAHNNFFDQRLFGYGYFFMRGLEYNVIDGHFGAALKTTLHQQVGKFILHNPFRSKTHDKIPFRFFLKVYGDIGYAANKYAVSSNTLNNTLLKSYGIGLDIVSIYDFVFKIEYSFNQLGREGVYLQSRNDF